MSGIDIRKIRHEDNAIVIDLVKNTLKEFGAVGDGYASADEELNDMYGHYQAADRCFFVVEKQGKVLGCGGFAPLDGEQDKGICELRKMYYDPQLRGHGAGKKLIDLCIEKARTLNYHSMYLETIPEMTIAQKLYQSRGFEYLQKNKGNTCHHACQVFMIKKL